MSNDLDIRYCDADCGKACARNKKKRVIFARGNNLQDIRCGRCVNYLPIFKLSKDDKKLFKLTKHETDREFHIRGVYSERHRK